MIILSCGSSSEELPKEQPKIITDDFKLIAVSDRGNVFEIGNNTGAITLTAAIEKESDATFLGTSSITASADKIYAIEYIYNPLPTNNLLVFDRQNGTTQKIPLVLPSTINGEERGIFALSWDNNNLIGILSENVLMNNSTKHLISINLQDNSVTELGISFNEDKVSSMKRINSKLYISTWGEGFLIVDLDNKSVTHLSSINGSRLAAINNSELAIMQPVSGSLGGAKPGIIDLNTQTVSDTSNGETFGLVTVFGNTIYKNGIYLNLVSSNRLNLYLGILKSTISTNTNSVVAINSTNVNRNLIIIGTTN
ncbi:hypothetical protein GCM10022260_08070 [Gaetbulibacter aestuarii]